MKKNLILYISSIISIVAIILCIVMFFKLNSLTKDNNPNIESQATSTSTNQKSETDASQNSQESNQNPSVKPITNPTNTSGWNIYENPEHKFSVKFPKDFTYYNVRNPYQEEVVSIFNQSGIIRFQIQNDVLITGNAHTGNYKFWFDAGLNKWVGVIQDEQSGGFVPYTGKIISFYTTSGLPVISLSPSGKQDAVVLSNNKFLVVSIDTNESGSDLKKSLLDEIASTVIRTK